MAQRPDDPRFMETLERAPRPSRPPQDVAQPALVNTLDRVTQPVGGARAMETLGYGDTLPTSANIPPPPPPTATTRTAVLPRLDVAGMWKPAQGDRFEEKSKLGRGAMGEVALAHDRDIDRMVAIKRLLPEVQSPAAVARFVEEIRTVGALEHPSIVPIHDAGVDGEGNYFFMMKHVEGQTLQQVIEKLASGDPVVHARFTFNARAQIFLAILQALKYAHAHGVVHRDLKPANIMVGPFGEVMVMDWGLARRAQGVEVAGSTRANPAGDARQTVAGSLVGTPAYMAPEQARGEVTGVDARSDIYALCVLFHELMALRHYLADCVDLEAVLRGVQERTVNVAEPAHPAQGPVPVEYVYFMQKGMEKDPAKRFQNVDEMVEVLQAILRGDIGVRCQVTLMKRVLHLTNRGMDRYPKATIVLSTLAAAVVLMNLVYAAGWVFG